MIDESAAEDLGPYKNRAIILARSLMSDAGIVSVPVSLKAVIEYVQETHDVVVQKAKDFSDKVSGILVTVVEEESKFALIGYNEKHPWCRRRFTIGHEIGHLLMGHACNQRIGDSSHDETEANLFASELLMPLDCLKVDFKKNPNIPNLAKRYIVSAEAMSYRLIRAKLLK